MTLAATRIATEQEAIEQIDRELERLEAGLRQALLTDNEPEISRLDGQIAKLKRQREHHLLRIDSLRAQESLEQRAAAAKQHEQLVGRVEVEMDELRKAVVKFQKHQAEAIKYHREWQDRAIRLATCWPWSPSDQNACGFNLDEVNRDTKYELCRIGSSQLLHAGALQRPSFPGGLNPKLDWLHSPEKIPALIDTIDQRHSIAKRVLRASLPETETQMEKAS